MLNIQTLMWQLNLLSKLNVDSLAVTIGTGHRMYATKSDLDFDRLNEMKNRISILIILHGLLVFPRRMCVNVFQWVV